MTEPGNDLEPGVRTDLADQLTYGRYLALDELLACQRPVSDSHDELMAILFENPLGRWGEYQVMALGTIEGEYQAMRKAGVI